MNNQRTRNKTQKRSKQKRTQQVNIKNNTRKFKNMSHKNSYVFKDGDFKSGDGMLTSVWGPSLWHTLHTISFNYPVHPTRQDKVNYRNFIMQLKHVLPCKYCRMNLKKNFKQLPLHMKHMNDRESFSKYVYDLHELINTMLNKKSGLSYEDVRQRYEHFRSRCSPIKSSSEIPAVVSVKNSTSKSNSKTRKIRKKHLGCVTPLHKVKSKGVVKIVPYETKCDSIEVHDKCFAVNA